LNSCKNSPKDDLTKIATCGSFDGYYVKIYNLTNRCILILLGALLQVIISLYIVKTNFSNIQQNKHSDTKAQ